MNASEVREEVAATGECSYQCWIITRGDWDHKGWEAVHREYDGPEHDGILNSRTLEDLFDLIEDYEE